MAFAIAPWILDTSEPDSHIWRIPGSLGSRIDRRSQAQVAAGIGFGLAEFDGLPLDPNAILLGEQLDSPVSVARKQELAGRNGLDLGETIVASTPRGIIRELCLRHGDPTWESRPVTIGVGAGSRVRIYLNGLIVDEPFELDVHEASAEMRLLAKYQYRTIYQRTQDGVLDPEMANRYLSVLMEQYRTSDYEQFIDSDLPNLTPLPHKSKIADDFVEESADTSLETHTATGPDAWAGSWARFNVGGGQADVIAATDQVEATSGTEAAWRAEADIDGGNQLATSPIADGDNGTRRRYAVLTRFDPVGTATGDHDYFAYRQIFDRTPDDQDITRVDDGESTDIGGPNSETQAGSFTLTGEVDSGGSHDLKVGGVSKVTASDNTYSANTKGGLRLRDNSTVPGHFTEWSLEDLAAGVNFTETPKVNSAAAARVTPGYAGTVESRARSGVFVTVTPQMFAALHPVSSSVATALAEPSTGVTESPCADAIADALRTPRLTYGLQRPVPTSARAGVVPEYAGTVVPFADAVAFARVIPGYASALHPFANAVALAIATIPAGANFTETPTALVNAFAALVQLLGAVEAPSSNATAVLTLLLGSTVTLDRPVPANALAGVVPGYVGTLSPFANATAFANARAGQAVILSVFANAVALAMPTVAYNGTLSPAASANALAGVTPGYVGTVTRLANATVFALVVTSQPVTIRTTALVSAAVSSALATAYALTPAANVAAELARLLGLAATLTPTALVSSAIGIGVAAITLTPSGIAVVSVSAEVTPSALEFVTQRLASLQVQLDAVNSRIGSLEGRPVEWEI